MHLKFASKVETGDLLVLPFWEEKKGALKAFTQKVEIPKNSDFKGKHGETYIVYPEKGGVKRIMLLGLGKKSDCTEEKLRRAYAKAGHFCRKEKLSSLSAILPQGKEAHLEVLEGIFLAHYFFTYSKKEKSAPSLTLTLPHAKGGEKDLKEALSTIECANFARTLVNENADDVTPERLEKEARKIAAKSPNAKIKVLKGEQLLKEKMGLHYAVGRAATTEPRLILIEYRGNPKSKDQIAIVGKGITYDTGGLSIKPSSGMVTMRADMGGAAAVLGAIKAVVDQNLPVNVIAAVAAAENCVDSKSYKPGDVFMSRSGKAVQIDNTDAEGRLVLADALTYVQDLYKPTALLDFATLTGAMVVALGEEVAGYFATHDALSKKLMGASDATGEALWRMPLYDDYFRHYKCETADFKNSGPRWGSAILAALFLKQFVQKGVQWAHLDIAGPAFLPNPMYYHSTCATGFGVRLLTHYFKSK